MSDTRIYGCLQCGKETPQSVLARTHGYCEADAMVTVREAMKALRYSRMTINRMMHDGRLHFVKVGPARNGKVLIPRWHVERILAGG